MPLLREDTCLEPPHMSEGHKKSAGEHQGLGGFWLPPLVLSLPNFGFSGNAQNELGTGFVWLGFTWGVWGMSQIKCILEINVLSCLCQVFH